MVHVGDWVLSIGYPWSLDETIPAGIVSEKSSNADYSARHNQTNIYKRMLQ